MIKGLGNQILVVGAFVLACLLVSAGGSQSLSGKMMAEAARYAGAVALVAAAVAVTWLAVHLVSDRRVYRSHVHDADEPPLPRHRPEPETGETSRAAPAVPRKAPAVPLPGRAPAVSDRSELTQPQPEEVTR
jgi:hypothetical protein